MDRLGRVGPPARGALLPVQEVLDAATEFGLAAHLLHGAANGVHVERLRRDDAPPEVGDSRALAAILRRRIVLAVGEDAIEAAGSHADEVAQVLLDGDIDAARVDERRRDGLASLVRAGQDHETGEVRVRQAAEREQPVALEVAPDQGEVALKRLRLAGRDRGAEQDCSLVRHLRDSSPRARSRWRATSR